MKNLLTSNGKYITIYDDLFSFSERTQFYNFAKDSFFKRSGDTGFLEHGNEFNLASHFSLEDVERMGFLNNSKVKPIIDKLNNFEFNQARVNLSTLSDTNYFHTDNTAEYSENITILYYLNMLWDIEWGGYTLFADDECKEIEYCVAYKAGRLIVFDGTIPHCIAPPTRQAPTIRMSFALQYRKK